MANVDWKPILIGVAVAGVAGLVLYLTLKKGGTTPPQNIGIFYTMDDDLAAVQYAQRELNATLVKGTSVINGGTVNDALNSLAGFDFGITLSVAGKVVNPLYAYALSQGWVKDFTKPGDKEVKEVTIGGYRILLAAGYDAIDTYDAVIQAVGRLK